MSKKFWKVIFLSPFLLIVLVSHFVTCVMFGIIYMSVDEALAAWKEIF